ncbi:MAG: PepSY domain-containing protein [Caulobacterales bacterium]|nr:PepSY domain-containing protein [Caulobacterales bacterium]
MKRLTILFAALLLTTGLPAVAQAQGCPKGDSIVARACRANQAQGGGQERPRGNSLGDSWAPREDEAREGVRGGRLVPLESVIRNIARSTPGRLLDAGLEDQGGRPIYRVRWQATNGQRIDFIVDARTGAIIGRN